MAALKNKDGNMMILTCKCGCDEGIRVEIKEDYGDYCYQTYISGNFYKEQGTLKEKLKKIWVIIHNKDFYYSDIVMTKEEWEEYKKWVNEK